MEKDQNPNSELKITKLEETKSDELNNDTQKCSLRKHIESNKRSYT